MLIAKSALLAVGTLAILASVLTIAAAARYPSNQAHLETWAGDLFLFGVLLLGFGFPLL